MWSWSSYSPEFIAGICGGSLGITLSYPFSTVKTRSQVWATNGVKYSVFKDLKNVGFRKCLYPGFSSPFIGTIAEKSVLFHTFGYLGKTTKLTDFQKGVISGFATTGIVAPYERVMIYSQVKNTNAFTAFKNIIMEKPSSLYRGWTATLFREVPGYGVYFYTFNRLDKFIPGESALKIMTCGAAAGISAWAVIYPTDPVKTVMQNDGISISQAVKKIRKQGSFFTGFGTALIRAGILHSGVFLGYTTALSFFPKTT